jgi:hypothetical protein
MNASGRGRARTLVTAIAAVSAIATAACGGSGGNPPVGAPPASGHTAAERAATLTWLAKTSRIWTTADFATLGQVTTGEARRAYQAEEPQNASAPIPSGRKPFRLTGLSITVPCHRGPETTFVAYADTDVFTLGQSMQPAALVFQRTGGVWKLAAVVNHSSGGGRTRWPALCRTGAGPAAPVTAPAVLAPADYGPVLVRTLDHASTGARETAAAAAPFAVNSFFSGPGSINVTSAQQTRQDRAGGVSLVTRFAPAADPTMALPLAGGRGYWLVGVFAQTGIHRCAAGIRKATWPDGDSVGSPRPAVVHHETDTFITTYTAIDPLRSSGGPVTLDGFFGWPLTATTS